MFMQCSRYVKADSISAVVYPMLLVAGMTVVGAAALRTGLVTTWGASPYVVLCALCASRVSLLTGLWCATLGILTHSWAFLAHPYEMDWPTNDTLVSYVAMIAVVLLVARRAPPVDRDPTETAPETLPFVAPSPSADNADRFWAIEVATGRWGDDVRLGAEYGRIYLAHWDRFGSGPLLGWIVRGMIARGQWSGVEAGFCGVLGREACCRRSDRARLRAFARSEDDPDDGQSQAAVV